MMITEGTRRRIFFFAALTAALSLVTLGAYALLAKFLGDRQTAMSDTRRPTREQIARRELRRRGAVDAAQAQRPGAAGQPVQRSPADAGQAAIQRQLRTLEEINRVNEMNRRLMEQQQRMQNQR